eukprot:s3057_g15.t1
MVLFPCRGTSTKRSQQRRAAELYLQALEWLLQNLAGPHSEYVQVACQPDGAQDAAKHLAMLLKQHTPEQLHQYTAPEAALCSKLLTVPQVPSSLDTHHHGSMVELWALTQRFNFDCLVWGSSKDDSFWVRTQAYLTDAEAHRTLACNPDTVEIGPAAVHGLAIEAIAAANAPPLPVCRAAAAAATSDSASRSRAVAGDPPRDSASHSRAVEGDLPLPPAAAAPVPSCGDSASHSPRRSCSDSASRSPQDDAADVWPQLPAGTAGDTDSSAAAMDLEVQSVLSWQSSADSADSDAGPEDVTVGDDNLQAMTELATAFRPRPLLPPPLPDQDPSASAADSGVAFPAMHCAFAGCDWCTGSQPCAAHWEHANSWKVIGCQWTAPCTTCCGDPSKCLWAHLKEAHSQHFRGTDIPSLYRQALIVHEEQHVPAVGDSVDRRTLRRLAASVQEEHVMALVCACCARVQPSGNNSDIGYFPVATLFGEMTTDSFNANWDFAQYSTTYGQHPSAATRLEQKLWVRTLPEEFFAGGAILCCPEDLQCNQCMQQDQQLWHACELSRFAEVAWSA